MSEPITDEQFCEEILGSYDLDTINWFIHELDDVNYNMPELTKLLEELDYGLIDQVIKFEKIELPDEVYRRAGIKKGAPLYFTFNNLCNGSYEAGVETEEGLLDHTDVAFCLFKTSDSNDWFSNPNNVVPIYIGEFDLEDEIYIAIGDYIYNYLDKNFDYEKEKKEADEDYYWTQENYRSIERSFH